MRYSSDNKPVINEDFQTDDLQHQFIPDEFPTAQQEKLGKSKKLEQKPAEADTIKAGIRLFRLKQWDKALQEFLQVDKVDFSSEQRVELAYYLGLCYTHLERFDDALLYFEQVIVGSNDALRVYQCRLTLAYIYIKTKRIRMAENELKRLRNAGFESAQLYNTLAYSAYIQKRFRDAVDLYEKALDLDKDNPTALNSMGYILADTGIDKMKGLRLCRRAVEYNPQNPAYLDSLGWAYYKCGEMMEARNLLRRAVELAPQEKEIQDHYRQATKGAM